MAEETFRDWFAANLGEYRNDIAAHGADAGYPHISYTADCVALYDRFCDEIWEMAVKEAEEYGAANVCEFMAGFNRADMMTTLDQFKNLLVWFACETVASEEQEE